MTTEHNEGFAEGFKAGWDAALSHLTPQDAVAFAPYPHQNPTVWREQNNPRACATSEGIDLGNPWTAHNRGLGGLTPEEYKDFQTHVSGVRLHTEDPDYTREDQTMHGTTRVF